MSCWLTEITTELISTSRGTEKSNIFHLEASWPWGTNPRAPSFKLNTQLAGSALSSKQGPRDWPLTWLSAHSSKPALLPAAKISVLVACPGRFKARCQASPRRSVTSVTSLCEQPPESDTSVPDPSCLDLDTRSPVQTHPAPTAAPAQRKPRESGTAGPKHLRAKITCCR